MNNSESAEITETIRQYYETAFKELDASRLASPVEVRFYPYVGINHTIRVRGGRIYVRIAEICRDMPGAQHRALAYILVSKLLGKRVPKHANEVYSSYIKTSEMRERAAESRRSNGRKVVTTPAGAVYDLDDVFDRVNIRYFAGRIEKPVLTWSARHTYRVLGHHDSTHRTIVVSRSLDAPDVPRFVVEYVVFHEMLHIHHPTRHVNGRRYNHTPAFRRDERRFAHFREAEDWIAKNVRKLKRRAKKK